MHASVRARIRYGGTDYSGNPYRPDALKGWNLREKGVDGATATTWVHDSTNLAPNGKTMEEEPLGRYENMLIDDDQEMKGKLFP